MPPFILVGLAAGLASAVLFASATLGNPAGRVLLFFLAPLPAFLAGLGWGAYAAALSGVASSLAIGALIGPKSGAVLFLSQGIPVTLLCHLAYLNRPAAAAAAAGEGPAQPAVEWYPPGRMMAWATVMAGMLSLMTLLLLGTGVDEVRKLLRRMLELFVEQMPQLRDRKMSETDMAALTELAIVVFPAATAFTWLAGLLVNLYLAGRITLASGRLARPWPDLAAIAFPRGFGLALAAALGGLLVLTGYPRLVASGFVGAFVFAYALLGLAIIHFVTRGLGARPLILWATYISLFFFHGTAAIVLAIVGALEPVLPWRRWKGPPPT